VTKIEKKEKKEKRKERNELHNSSKPPDIRHPQTDPLKNSLLTQSTGLTRSFHNAALNLPLFARISREIEISLSFSPSLSLSLSLFLSFFPASR